VVIIGNFCVKLVGCIRIRISCLHITIKDYTQPANAFLISSSAILQNIYYLASSAAYIPIDQLRHGESCLLYVILGNADIKPALAEWISLLQLKG
jgi:hypothetical protein